MALRRSPKPGALTATRVNDAANFVDNEGGKGVAVHVFGDNHERAAGLRDFFQNGNQVGGGADFLLVNQHERVFNDRFHALRVGHEVGRDVAFVELHTVHEIGVSLKRFAFFDRDNAVLPDFLNGVRYERADFGVVARDTGNAGDFLFIALDGNGKRFEFFNRFGDRRLNAFFHEQGIAARADVAKSLIDNGLRENRRRRGSVARNVVGFAGDFFHQLRAHILIRVFQFNLPSPPSRRLW